MSDRPDPKLPPRLPPGGTIGVCAPSSPVSEESLSAGCAALRQAGYRVVVAPHALDRHGHLAGLDVDRASDLHGLFADASVDAIFCARGGSGSIRLLPLLDWDLIAANPKPFVGYSDITSLHLAIQAACGTVSFFGPMVTSEFHQQMGPESLDHFWRLLMEARPAGALTDPRCADAIPLVAGKAEGRLVGGTLSLLAASMGTPFEPDLRDAIFFFEDIHESPAHIERFLVQLLLAGKLREAAGFLVGSIRWSPDAEEALRYLTFHQVFEDVLVPLGRPVLLGWPSGHVRSPLMLPLGCRVRLDADRRSLEVLTAAVR